MIEMLMKQKNKKGNIGDAFNYVHCYASMADVVVLANELKQGDDSVTLDEELLEFILTKKFGFDNTKTVFRDWDSDGNRVDHWFESHYCTHKPLLSNIPVTTDRFIGVERLDDEWYKSGLMSTECWKIYKGV